MKHCHFSFPLQAMQSLCMSLVYCLVYPTRVDKCRQQKAYKIFETAKILKVQVRRIANIMMSKH